jgi:cholesterol oxidase
LSPAGAGPDEQVPKTSWDIRKFAWQPEAEMYGIQRIEFLDDVLVLCGAGVGGGSHHYAQTLYVPPKKFFDAPEWAGITDWADELAPYIDQASPYMDGAAELRKESQMIGTHIASRLDT